MRAAVIGQKSDAAARYEQVVMSRTKDVGKRALAAKRSEQLITRTQIGGANKLVSVYVDVRPFGTLASAATDVIDGRKRTVRTGQIIKTLIRLLSADEHGHAFVIAYRAALDRSPRQIFSVITGEVGAPCGKIGVRQPVLAVSRSRIEFDEEQPHAVRTVYEERPPFRRKKLRIDRVGRAPARGRLHEQFFRNERTVRR